MFRGTAIGARYRPLYRRSGYVLATGPGSALFSNSARFRFMSGVKAWANRARRNVARRKAAMKNFKTYGYATYKRIR